MSTCPFGLQCKRSVPVLLSLVVSSLPVCSHRARTVQHVLVGFIPPPALVAVALSLSLFSGVASCERRVPPAPLHGSLQ